MIRTVVWFVLWMLSFLFIYGAGKLAKRANNGTPLYWTSWILIGLGVFVGMAIAILKSEQIAEMLFMTRIK